MSKIFFAIKEISILLLLIFTLLSVSTFEVNAGLSGLSSNQNNNNQGAQDVAGTGGLKLLPDGGTPQADQLLDQTNSSPNSDTSSGSTISADSNNNSLVDTMCSAFRLVTGSAGKAFAAFAIISVGIGFFTGKVSWGLMIGVAMGIAAMFGAPTIVAALADGSSYSCSY